MDNYIIRKLQAKDVKYIKGLWEKHFGSAIAAKRAESFNWILKGNPYSETKDDYFVMEEDGNIIAYCGLMPSKFYLTGKNYTGYIYHDTMVNPNQRGKGIGTKLIEGIIKQNPLFSIAVWMNAPNARVFEKCGWESVNNLPTYVRGYNTAAFVKLKWKSLNKISISILNLFLSAIYKLEKASYFYKKNKFTIEAIDQFDDRVDSLFYEIKNEYSFITYRTQEILNWKYSQAIAPHYSKLICNQGGKLVGYIVFRTRDVGEGKIVATLFDYLFSLKNMDVFTALLKNAIIEIEKEKPDSIEILCSNNTLRRVLNRFGFIKHTDNQFALKYINHDSIAGSEQLSNGNNWFFTHGDGDKIFWDL